MPQFSSQTIKELGERHGYLFFWGHTEAWGALSKACLSQWYPCQFTVDGQIYSSAEQYMMAQKAYLMGDHATLAMILATSDPMDIKKLGRKVHPFDDELWKRHKVEVVKRGNLAKFSQNPALAAFLLSTGERVLVEASPYDKIWGIGMAESNPDATVPAKWRGLNLLGFALMEVRDVLRQAMASQAVRCGVTPAHISTLRPGEVFVFGSNLAGAHAGGAARAALEHFGAVWGVGVGLQGRSYAIPTMHGGVTDIRPYVDRFIDFAASHPELHFLVTPIGCGIAGFRPDAIAPLFARCLGMTNVSLPAVFIDILTKKH